MADSYKIRTYPTLHSWKPLHKKIIEQYENCPNKAEFVRLALECFGENGFPGLNVEMTTEPVEVPDIQLRTTEHDTLKEMEDELGDLC